MPYVRPRGLGAVGDPCHTGPTCNPGEMCSQIEIGGTLDAAGKCQPVHLPISTFAPPLVAPPGTDAVGYPYPTSVELAARTARCHRTQLTQTVGLLGAGGAAMVFLPGAWKLLGLLALPAVVYAGFGGAPFRSADCDYGL